MALAFEVLTAALMVLFYFHECRHLVRREFIRLRHALHENARVVAKLPHVVTVALTMLVLIDPMVVYSMHLYSAIQELISPQFSAA